MERTLEILEKLIGFETVSHQSNLGIIAYVEDLLNTCGFMTHRVLDESGQKAGLFAVSGPAGPGVMVSAHTDVVPVVGQNWTKEPFRLTREGTRLYGRGTTDMKGYLAAMLSLAEKAVQADLKEPLKLSISFDEEVGCVGIRKMIDKLEPSIGLPRACFVGEPTEMQVAVGHKGKAAMRAICHGQNGHSALAPQFVNALHLATGFVGELQAVQRELAETGVQDPAYDIPYSTVHVGKFTGGTALNIVPDQAELIFEYRHLAADTPAMMDARIQAASERAILPYRDLYPQACIEIDKYNAYPGLGTAEGADVVSFAQRLAQSNEVTKVAFGTEAGFFDNLGVSTVVCGPGSMAGQGHKPDEYVTLDQMAACTAMMDRLLKEISR